MSVGLYLGANYGYQNTYDISNYIIIRSEFFPEEPREIIFKNEVFIDSHQTNVNISNNQLEQFRQMIYNDGNVIELWERLPRKKKLKYQSMDRAIKIKNISTKILKNLLNYNFRQVIFSYYPHNIITYILQKALKFLDIPYTIIDTCMFHWRLKAYDQDGKLLSNRDHNPMHHERSVTQIFEDIKKKSKVFYMPRNISPKINQSPLNFLRSLKYKSLFKDKMQSDKKTITVYLNYQPESTTFPSISDHAFVYNYLSNITSCCSKSEFDLQIKEHPVQFQRFAPNWRSLTFMSELRKKNCKLLDNEVDQVNLLRCSSLVASLNGSVLIERLLLGLPIIHSEFSSIADYKGPGVIWLSDNIDADYKTLASVKTIKESFKEYLLEQGKVTFGPSSRYISKDYNLEKWRADRYKAINQILSVTT